jgi:hypothetical protein
MVNIEVKCDVRVKQHLITIVNLFFGQNLINWLKIDPDEIMIFKSKSDKEMHIKVVELCTCSYAQVSRAQCSYAGLQLPVSRAST